MVRLNKTPKKNAAVSARYKQHGDEWHVITTARREILLVDDRSRVLKLKGRHRVGWSSQ